MVKTNYNKQCVRVLHKVISYRVLCRASERLHNAYLSIDQHQFHKFTIS